MSFLTSILKAASPLIPAPMLDKIAREYFNHHYRALGHMTKLQIDSANRHAKLELDLKGETQPLQITIGRYAVTSTGGKTFIEIEEITTSREWLTLLARQFTKGKTFELPELIASVL